jgi:uridine kinase
MVRDSRHRNSDAVETYELWDNVKKNESTSIEPFRKYADVTINTFFEYERSILNDDAVALLNTVGETDEYYSSARELISILETAEPIGDEYIPENSLLWEFL